VHGCCGTQARCSLARNRLLALDLQHGPTMQTRRLRRTPWSDALKRMVRLMLPTATCSKLTTIDGCNTRCRSRSAVVFLH